MQSKPPHSALNEFIFFCRKIATAFLRRKTLTGKLDPKVFSMPLEDVALDCLADLFIQIDDGTLVQVKAYFESIAYDKLSEEELQAHTQRLVFAKVNQGLFRAYHEIDPTLSKILRNMKSCLLSVGNFVETERFGETWMQPAMCNVLEHLPCIDRDELERELSKMVSRNDYVPTLLASLATFLRGQTSYRRSVPLMQVAFVFRSLYENKKNAPAQHQTIEQTFLVNDTIAIINKTCRQIEQEMFNSYVKRKFVQQEMYEQYFTVIRQHLCDKIINLDGEATSYFESLRTAHPCLTKEEYQQHHKAKIEYLSSLAYKRAIAELRKHL
ncbi:MAG: hypothetical protein HYZ33_03900 [Ignavibacteriales bacterium]|nr:hypothetical protein [Ignavibacteriales bacterium]